MEICRILADVRLELNHIYTEKPLSTTGGWDMGWFCREHALHIAALARILGYKAQLCCGDIVIIVPGDSKDLEIFTLGSGSDHAWCRINGEAPFDASVTLKYLAPTQADVQMVCPDCPQYLAGFTLQYKQGMADDSFALLLESSNPIIAYNEKVIIARDPLELLADPFDFLNRPAPGCPTYIETFGADVFFAITAHLNKLARGEIKPMRMYYAPLDAIRRIVKHNPKARAFVTETAEIERHEISS